MSAANKRKADFWYGVPGGWYGDADGRTSNPYVIVDSARIFEAVQYFNKHRGVVVLSTGWPVQSHANGYGPVCAKKYALPWDATKQSKQANDPNLHPNTDLTHILEQSILENLMGGE